MPVDVLLSPAVSAHPLLRAAGRAVLRSSWPGKVFGMSGGEHSAHLRGATMNPRYLAERLIREGEVEDGLVVIHDGDVDLHELREAHPELRIEVAVVDADAYSATTILGAAEDVLARSVDEPW